MAYSTKTWAKAKAKYETGNYSIPEIGVMLGISHTSIENKISKYKWVKGKDKPKIEQSIAQKNIERFAKLGMTQEKVAQKMIDGVEDKEDKNTALNYIKELNKMCGTLAPVKKETDLTSDGEKLVLPQIYLPHNGRNPIKTD